MAGLSCLVALQPLLAKLLRLLVQLWIVLVGLVEALKRL